MAISQRPGGSDLLVDGDFNLNLAEPERNAQDEDIAAALAADVLD